MFAKDYRHRAWNKLSGKWGTFICISLVAGLITGACGGSVSFGGSHLIGVLIGLVVSAVIYSLVGGPLNLGVASCFLKLARGQNA